MEYKEDPLQNLLVLRKILENLRPNNICQARLVCKLWHDEFTPKLSLKFKSAQDYSDFIYNYYPENNNNLKCFFRSFDFRQMQDISGFRSDNEVRLFFSCFPFITNVRKLSLPSLPLFAFYPVFSQFPDLETFEAIIDSGFYKSNNKEKLFKMHPENQEVIKMNNLRIVRILSNRMSEKASGFITEFFESIPYIVEFELISSIDPNTFEYWINGLMEKQPTFLSKIKVSWDINNETMVNWAKMLELTEKLRLKNVKINGAELIGENVQGFIKILINYDILSEYSNQNQVLPESINELRENSKIFTNVQLKDVKILKNVFWDMKINLQQILFHFPNLERVDFNENLEENSLINVQFEKNMYGESEDPGENKSFSKMINFKYSCSKLAVDGMSEKICQIFPNLNILHIETTDLVTNLLFNSVFNLKPIFENLTKLREFTFIAKSGELTDEDVTGIPEDFIESNLRNKSLEFLQNFNIQEIPGKTAGISGLKDLRKLFLKIGKGPSELGLLFGFLFLDKLESLGFHLPFMNKLSDEYWDLILENFPFLEKLQIDSFAKAEKLNYIKTIRPFVTVEAIHLINIASR